MFCLNCNKELLNQRSDATCCSKKCSDSIYRKGKKVLNCIICTHCKIEFKTNKRSDTKYCSKKCTYEKKFPKRKNKEYYLKNRDKIKERSKIYHNKVKETPEFKEKNRIYRRQYEHLRALTDINYKLKRRLRIRLHSAIKTNAKHGSSVDDLGCSIEYLKFHLESLFKPGMNWSNWGNGEGKWNIDHKIPLKSFDLTIREQFLKACHYTNLQPLWWIDNIKKGCNNEV